MTGRGIDQVLPHPCAPQLFEPMVTSAQEYVELAERANGPIPRPVDYRYAWGDALAILEAEHPQVRIINLETSISTSDAAEPKGINYRMHPANVGVLSAAGIDCCVLANNHVLDWGDAGLLDTLQILDRANIARAGAGRTREEAEAPAVLGDPSARVLVFAFGTGDSGIPRRWAATEGRPGVHRLVDLSDGTVDGIAKLVAAAKRADDLVVASIHWGPNWGFDETAEHRRFAHALVERVGVDVVHGHSCHHPMAIEVYRQHPILYGCGDLIDDYEGIGGNEEYRADLGLMYFLTLDARSGSLLRLTMVPLRRRRFRLWLAGREDRAWMRDTLERECGRFGHRVVSLTEGFELYWH